MTLFLVLLASVIFGCSPSCTTVSPPKYGACSPIRVSPITHKLFYENTNIFVLEFPNSFPACQLSELQIVDENENVIATDTINVKYGGIYSLTIKVDTQIGESGELKAQLLPVDAGIFSNTWKYSVIAPPTGSFILEARGEKVAFYLTKQGIVTLSLDGVEYGWVATGDVIFLPKMITKTQLRLVWVDDYGTPTKIETFVLDEHSYQ